MDGEHLEGRWEVKRAVVEVAVRIEDEVSQLWRESFQRFPEQMEAELKVSEGRW